MKIALTILVSLIISVSSFARETNTVFYFGGKTNTFLAYYKSTWSPNHVAPEKATCLTNGITFKGVVDVLGPGFRPPSEGIGFVSWPFSDGRTLSILIPHHPRNGSTPLKTNDFKWDTSWPRERFDEKFPPPEPRYLVW
jgi:hypothetical protein